MTISFDIIDDEILQQRTATIGSTTQCARSWRVSTDADEDEAEVAAAVRAALLDVGGLPTVAGLPLNTVSVQPNADLEGGDHSWVATGVYGAGAASWGGEQSVNTTRRSFKIGGSQQKVFRGVATISRTAPAGGTARDFKGLINVTDDGVEGVEVFVPEYVEKVTRVFEASEVDNAYRGVLADTVGKVNNATFIGFAAGEALLLSVEGEQRQDLSWELSFEFGISRNRTDIDAGGGITVPAKKGWEYLWVTTKEAVDAGRKVVIPEAAYVEQVYETADFAALNAIAATTWPPLWTP